MTTKKSSTSTKKAPAKKPAAKSVARTTTKKAPAKRDNFRTGITVALVALCVIEAISIPFFIHAFVNPDTSTLEAPTTGDVEIVTDQEEPSIEDDAAADTEEVEAAATSSPAPKDTEDKTSTKKPATTTTTPTTTTTTTAIKPTTTKKPTTSSANKNKPAKPAADKNDDESYLEHENRPDYTVDETPADVDLEDQNQ